MSRLPHLPRSRLTVVCVCGGLTAVAVLATAHAGAEERSGGFVEVEDGHVGRVVRIPVEERSRADEPSPTDPAAAEDASGARASDGGEDQSANQEDRQDQAREAPLPFDDPRLDRERPEHFRRPLLRRCRRYRRRRFCDGPRRVPAPEGEAATRDERLGISRRASRAFSILEGEPPEEWTAATPGVARDDLQLPLPDGRIGRGLSRGRGRRPAHRGVDIVASEHTPVRAANDGLVVYAESSIRGYGNAVMLLHPDGTLTFYAHLWAAWVAPGEAILRGEPIGEVGRTGLATGPHLHFEWRRDGRPLNPLPRFRRRP